MHGTVLLDQDSRPVHPAIIWADQRTVAECRALSEVLVEQEYANITGDSSLQYPLGTSLRSFTVRSDI
jgi:xylulokinase